MTANQDALHDDAGEFGRRRLTELLRRHRISLEQSGIKHISLFGSVARGTATSLSDVDLAVELLPGSGMSLLAFVGIERRLEELIGRPVDLVLEPTTRADLQLAIDRDRIRAF